MKLIKVEFTKEQLANLHVFLNRVDLKGSEVPAFVEIIQVLGSYVVEDNKQKSKHVPIESTRE